MLGSARRQEFGDPRGATRGAAGWALGVACPAPGTHQGPGHAKEAGPRARRCSADAPPRRRGQPQGAWSATCPSARPPQPRGRTCSNTVLGVTFTVWRRPFGASTDTAEPPPPAGAAMFRSRDPAPARLHTTLSATAAAHSHAAAGGGGRRLRIRALRATPPGSMAPPLHSGSAPGGDHKPANLAPDRAACIIPGISLRKARQRPAGEVSPNQCHVIPTGRPHSRVGGQRGSLRKPCGCEAHEA